MSFYRLKCPEIRGAGSAPELLSNAGAQFMHELIDTNTLKELKFENVKLQDSGWEPIVKNLSFSLLKVVALRESFKGQLESNSKAARLYHGRLLKEEKERERTRTTKVTALVVPILRLMLIMRTRRIQIVTIEEWLESSTLIYTNLKYRYA